ncbi:hypothetical protein C7974DRAFT_85294 [Boeremia exigua]|uniref:uncharacterized protein n=1 Tax=Boeremia exigua TaxID=749465 RepID=UPI001E8D0EDE|nr:uncharacterized protein C7974DRAFT_85294 [Boeremia exigua]KAH6611805.1 hypothetical protein C7974DRAFT_85294 [Boeremia exigua]
MTVKSILRPSNSYTSSSRVCTPFICAPVPVGRVAYVVNNASPGRLPTQSGTFPSTSHSHHRVSQSDLSTDRQPPRISTCLRLHTSCFTLFSKLELSVVIALELFLSLHRMSSSISTGSSPVNTGTVTVRLTPYTEASRDGDSRLEQFEVISAQQECISFSLEELRLADYEQGHGSLPRQRNKGSATQAFRRSNNKMQNSHLDLLTGPAIEIRVGTTTSVNSSNDHTVNWFLPKALISRHSPFLAAACNRDFKERHENLIELPDDDPTVFALFVEWLYYGEYAIQPLSLKPRLRDDLVSVDAECWVLGDKLLCTDFKNYAMKRLYNQHAAGYFNISISTDDVRFASSNSATSSKLRELYVHLAATHFGNPNRVQGTVEEWDELLVNQADLRRLLLQSLCLDAKQRKFVRYEEYYMDHGDAPV